jgi:hypothetical protein
VTHAFFTAGQVHPAGDAGDGLTGWWVDLPGVSYRGRAVAPADWDETRVLEALNRHASVLGESVFAGRLYSRTRLDVNP